MSTYSLYDKFVNVTFYKDDTVVSSIDTPTSGMKPDIGFSVNLLEGQVCYQCELKVRNFNVDVSELRTWTDMVIEAGYYVCDSSTDVYITNRVTKYITLKCPIFSAYPETPNPDGITVFNGLCVGSIKNAFTEGEIDVHVYGEVTLRELIKKVLDKAGAQNARIAGLSLPQAFLERKIVGEQLQNAYAESGYALIAWLGRVLADEGNSVTDYEMDVRLIPFNGNVYIFDALHPSPVDGIYEPVVGLDIVSRAYYSGPVLNVEAPFNPALLPGCLFEMKNSYFSAPLLTNEISSSVYTGEKDQYRVIKMSVEFSTRDENKMTVLALPAQYMKGGYKSSLETTRQRTWEEELTARKDSAASRAARGISKSTVDALIIGTPPKQEFPTALKVWNSTFSATPSLTVRVKTYTTTPSATQWVLVAKDKYASLKHTLTAEEASQIQTKINTKYPTAKITVSPGYVIYPEQLWLFVLYVTYRNYASNQINKQGAKDSLFIYNSPGDLVVYNANMNIHYKQITSWSQLKGAGDIFTSYYDVFHKENDSSWDSYLITGFATEVLQ